MSTEIRYIKRSSFQKATQILTLSESLVYHSRMASSSSLLSLPLPSQSTRYIAYDPLRLNSTSRSKIKAKAKKPVQSLSDTVSFGAKERWFDINDFPKPDSSLSRPSDQVDDATILPSLGAVGALDACPFMYELEPYQPTQASVDKGETDLAMSSIRLNSSTNGVFDGGSLGAYMSAL